MNFIKQYQGLRKEVYVLFIGRIATRFGSMVWSMLTLILNQKLGYSASDISRFMVIVTISSMLMNVLGGKLADRYSKKGCIIFFDIISIVLYLICAAIPLSNLTVALIVISAAAQWAEFPAYNALIADITPSADRERAYALQYLGTNIGMMLAPTLAGFLFKDHLSLLFVICAAAIAVSTILITWKVVDITPIVEEEYSEQQRRDGDSLWTVLKENKILLLFFLGYGLYGAAYDQYNYLMPLDLGRMYGEDGALIFGTVTSTNCLIAVLFSPVILAKFNQMIPVRKLFAGEVLILVGFVVFLAFIELIPAYYVAIILFTFGEIFATIGQAPFITAHSPASHRGRINGLFSASYNVIVSLTLLAVGWLYDGRGYVTAWIFVILIVLASMTITFAVDRIDAKKDCSNSQS